MDFEIVCPLWLFFYTTHAKSELWNEELMETNPLISKLVIYIKSLPKKKKKLNRKIIEGSRETLCHYADFQFVHEQSCWHCSIYFKMYCCFSNRNYMSKRIWVLLGKCISWTMISLKLSNLIVVSLMQFFHSKLQLADLILKGLKTFIACINCWAGKSKAGERLWKLKIVKDNESRKVHSCNRIIFSWLEGMGAKALCWNVANRHRNQYFVYQCILLTT